MRNQYQMFSEEFIYNISGSQITKHKQNRKESFYEKDNQKKCC